MMKTLFETPELIPDHIPQFKKTSQTEESVLTDPSFSFADDGDDVTPGKKKKESRNDKRRGNKSRWGREGAKARVSSCVCRWRDDRGADDGRHVRGQR